MEPIVLRAQEARTLQKNIMTQKRFVVTPQPRAFYYDGRLHHDEDDDSFFAVAESQQGTITKLAPPYQPGDILYVQEPWAMLSDCPTTDSSPSQLSDYPIYQGEWLNRKQQPTWRSANLLTCEYARFFLRIVHIHAERLLDITEEEAVYEGSEMKPRFMRCNNEKVLVVRPQYKIAYLRYWDERLSHAELPLYGSGANPWTWVVKFERITKEEAYGMPHESTHRGDSPITTPRFNPILSEFRNMLSKAKEKAALAQAAEKKLLKYMDDIGVDLNDVIHYGETEFTVAESVSGYLSNNTPSLRTIMKVVKKVLEDEEFEYGQ